MTIFTERDAIREKLSHIREEKSNLREMYREMSQALFDRETELLSRLRELDERDIELSGGTGIYDVQGLITDLGETIVRLKELVPMVPVKVLLDEVRKQVNSEESPVILSEKEDKGLLSNPKFREEVTESVARENRVKGVNAVKRDIKETEFGKIKFSGKKGAPVVRGYLEKAGRPVQLKKLVKELEKAGFEPTINGTERLKSIMGVEPRIKAVSRGYYQFVK